MTSFMAVLFKLGLTMTGIGSLAILIGTFFTDQLFIYNKWWIMGLCTIGTFFGLVLMAIAGLWQLWT